MAVSLALNSILGQPVKGHIAANVFSENGQGYKVKLYEVFIAAQKIIEVAILVPLKIAGTQGKTPVATSDKKEKRRTKNFIWSLIGLIIATFFRLTRCVVMEDNLAEVIIKKTKLEEANKHSFLVVIVRVQAKMAIVFLPHSTRHRFASSVTDGLLRV